MAHPGDSTLDPEEGHVLINGYVQWCVSLIKDISPLLKNFSPHNYVYVNQPQPQGNLSSKATLFDFHAGLRDSASLYTDRHTLT